MAQLQAHARTEARTFAKMVTPTGVADFLPTTVIAMNFFKYPDTYERLYFVSGFIRTACKLFLVGRSARRSAGRSAGRPARRPAGRSSAARVSSAAPKKNHLIEAAPFGRLDQM